METSTGIEASIDITWVDITEHPEWKKMTLQVDISSVTELIAKAQMLIASTTKNISKSIIEISVKGPDCSDLTLIDLPGIVHSVGKNENQNLIKDINELIESYISNPRCIILAIIPCNVDYHTAKVIDYIKEFDKETNRTIAVLTKLDLVEKQTESSVIDFIEGKVLSFQYPVYMVKCRTQVELNDKMSLAESITSELNYFLDHKVWSTLDNHTHFFGVEQLKQQLSQIQLDVLKSSIPYLKNEIMQKLKTVNKNLDTFAPEFPNHHDRVLFVNERLEIYIGQVRSLLSGELLYDKNSTFYSKLAEIFSEYQRKLLETSLANLNRIKIDSQVTFKFEMRTLTGIVTNESHDDSYDWDFVVKCNGTGELYKVRTDKCNLDKTFLKEFIQQHRSKEIPSILDANLFNQLVITYIKNEWKDLFIDVLNQSNEVIKRLFTFHDEKISLNHPDLDRLIKFTLIQLHKSTFELAQSQINEALLREMDPYSQNPLMFNHFKLNDKVSSNYNGIIDDQISIHLFNAIDVYGKIAYARVLDVVPQIIRSMLRDIETSIRKATIFEGKALDDSMIENKRIVNERKLYKEKKRVLELAMVTFENFVYL